MGMTLEEACKAGEDVIACHELDKVDGFPGCCGSCHTEWDEGYSEPTEIRVHNRIAVVCCKVAHWINSQLPKPE